MAVQLDPELDESRVFSYRVLDPDPNNAMFRPTGESYEEFKSAVAKGADASVTAMKADVTGYYVHINHHTLENLLTAAGVPEGINRLIVKTMLQTWSGRFSYGIPQGLFPSHLLGNYYLSAFDTQMASRGVLSVRYVDDFVLFYNSEYAARANISLICKSLRSIGLDLNESKTRIMSAQQVVHEETELDQLFEAAKEDVYENILVDEDALPYGFQDSWIPSEAQVQDLAESEALNALWANRPTDPSERRDQLDRFCIGAFGRLGSIDAVDVVLSELGQRPHMTRTYCGYLSKFAGDDPSIRDALCSFFSGSTAYDSEMQWPIAALLTVSSIPKSTVTAALGILQDPTRSHELRALCAIMAGRFGDGPSRTVLRNHWGSENSDHVKAAMVFSLMYFVEAERKVLLTLWGSQGDLFAMTAKAVRKVLQAQQATP